MHTKPETQRHAEHKLKDEQYHFQLFMKMLTISSTRILGKCTNKLQHTHCKSSNSYLISNTIHFACLYGQEKTDPPFKPVK